MCIIFLWLVPQELQCAGSVLHYLLMNIEPTFDIERSKANYTLTLWVAQVVRTWRFAREDRKKRRKILYGFVVKYRIG